MGMSTRVTGFRPPDEKWKHMKAVWDSCRAAGVEVPEEVAVFFDDREPDPAGVQVAIESRMWKDDMKEGVEIDVDKIPADVKVIRFYNSW